MLKIKRVYDPVGDGDGFRFLVERLWPRGVRKDALKLDAWLKDVAPSVELRRWFSHDPGKWDEFRLRYRAELKKNRAALEPILTAMRKDRVTLLYSAHDQVHNNAVALKEFLESGLPPFKMGNERKEKPGHEQKTRLLGQTG